MTHTPRSARPFLLAPLALAGALVAAPACGEDPAAPGHLEARIWGEAFIEEGIPAAEFADGWAIEFDRFLIGLRAVSAARAGQAAALQSDAGWVFDLAPASRGLGFPVTAGMVPGGRYDRIAYRIAPAAAEVQGGNASAADRAALRAAGASVIVTGRARKGTMVKSFDWAFTGDTEYADCAGTARVDGQPAAAPARTQLTIHGDHLFYDSLTAEEPDLRFDLVAQADADGDDVITQAELAAVEIGTQANYGTGSTGVANLWAFLAYQTSTLGHIDGEGHCARTVRR